MSQGTDRRHQIWASWVLTGEAWDDASAVSIVIFPGGRTTNEYRGSITIKPNVIDWDIVYGKKYLFLHACVMYKTFGKVRHTSVCYYAQAGETVGSLPFCDQGNRAD